MYRSQRFLGFQLGAPRAGCWNFKRVFGPRRSSLRKLERERSPNKSFQSRGIWKLPSPDTLLERLQLRSRMDLTLQHKKMFERNSLWNLRRSSSPHSLFHVDVQELHRKKFITVQFLHLQWRILRLCSMATAVTKALVTETSDILHPRTGLQL